MTLKFTASMVDPKWLNGIGNMINSTTYNIIYETLSYITY